MTRFTGPSGYSGGRSRLGGRTTAIAVATGFALLLIVASIGFSIFGFVWDKVETHEVGVITKAGKPVEVVGPGVYTKFGFGSFYDMVTFSTSQIAFCVEDKEVLTKADGDSNPIRIGVIVCGDLFRPSLAEINEMGHEQFFALFTKYRPLFLSDDPILGWVDKDGIFHRGLIQQKAPQAMKGCIGQGDFYDAAVGTSRNTTADCHHEALSELVVEYHFTVENVTVPDIGIPEEVGKTLDTIAKAQFDTEAENELADLAKAQADRQQAEKEGQIRVAQAERQERLRQDIETAQLEEESELAQMAVIEAKMANEKRYEELNFEVAERQLRVALKQAEIDSATEAYLISLYAEHPEYMAYLIDLALAGSFGEMDKVFLEVGTTPRMLIGPDGSANVVVDVESSGE